MVKLKNVIDIRTGRHHTTAIVSERNAKWFVPDEASDEPETVESESE